ncbi:hypothetical protein ACLB2K_005807 [Fragaria x ananassa]
MWAIVVDFIPFKKGIKTAETEQLLQHSLPSIDSTIVTRQLPSQGLSFQLWPAATTLLTLLDDHRRDPTASPLGLTLLGLKSGRRLKILELGSGTGLVGIAAAATLGACVTVTDLPHVTDNLRYNVELNAAVLGGSGGSVSVAALRWGEAIGREFDLVLASDVVYHDHLYEPLLKTLSFLLLGEGGVVFVRWKKTRPSSRGRGRFLRLRCCTWIVRAREPGLELLFTVLPGSRVRNC